MPTVPIPIAKGVFKNVSATNVQASELATELKNIVIDDMGANIGRPGLKETAFASTGTSFGIYGLKYFSVSNTVVIVDTNRRIWSVTESGVVTEITGLALGGSSRPVFDTDGEFLAIAGGGAPQTWSGTGNTTLMAGSPVSCTHMGYLDGYWINHLLDDQEFRLAGPTAVTRLTWNTGDFFQAEGLPDNVKAQAVLLRELYSFGAQSTEIFQNFGTANPFQRTFFVDRGISAPYSLTHFDNTLAWLDNERRIVRLDGRTPVQFNSANDKIIKNYGTVDDCWSTEIQIGGFYFLVFVFPTEETSWAYDYKRGEWYEWDGFAAGISTRLPIHSHCFVPEWNKHLVGDPSTGIVRELSFDAKVDGGRALRRLRRMRYNHGSAKRKRSNYFLFHVERGVGTPGSTEPVMEVRVNDDNRGWSDMKQVALGFPGESTSPIRVRMGGIYRERQLEVQMTEPYDFTLRAIEEDIDGLES